MKNVASDPYSRGRNFAGHYSMREWNIAPVTSPIEVQFSIAIGTGTRAARRHRREGHHDRARRRRRQRRGRLRDRAGVELAQGRRAAAADDRHEQSLRHFDAVRGPARARARLGSRQAVRHADRRRRWQRLRSELRGAAERRCTTCARSASHTCSRRWCRACAGTRPRAARTSSRNEVDCLERVENTLADRQLMTRAEDERDARAVHATSSARPRSACAAKILPSRGDRRATTCFADKNLVGGER